LRNQYRPAAIKTITNGINDPSQGGSLGASKSEILFITSFYSKSPSKRKQKIT
jgi:hypothetical protein